MELTKEQTQKLIELAGINLQPEEVNQITLSRLLVAIEQKMNTFSCPRELHFSKNLKLLIVDDLELSIYQLTKVLEKIGITPSVARDKNTALAEIKKNKFNYLVVDLYLPDLSDGLELIEEATKIKKATGQNFKIFSISSTNDETLINKCTTLTDAFVPKSKNWHEEILRLVAIDINKDCPDNQNFSKHTVDNDAVVYDLYKSSTKECLNDFIADLKITLAMGTKNIVVNFENIKFFDKEYSNFFADLYKTINSSGGKFVILNPNEDVKDILDETFLSDIIQTTSSLSESLKILQQME